MNFSVSRLRLTRTGIFLILAMLVALLGAAAKHSQFDGPPHQGYLSKAVKMCGARIDPNAGTDSAQAIASPIAQPDLDTSDAPVAAAPAVASFRSVSLLSPPLRV